MPNETMPPINEEMYYVVRNHEEQHSIWRIEKPVPAGWETVGEAESKEACLRRIEELWTDMRPASLRKTQSRNLGIAE